MKITGLAIISILLISRYSLSATPVEAWGQLRVQGNHIISTKTGQPVQLTGMCLFWSQWAGELWNADVVNWLADDWKCTVLRISMGVEAGGYLENPVAEKAKVITVVDACIKKGIYVIIDWHDHYAENHLAQSKAFFIEMAQKYGDKPNVMYELFNEPTAITWAVVRDYCNAVTAEIRKIDKDNIVHVATPSWDSQITMPLRGRVNDSNSVYVCHFYVASAPATFDKLIGDVAKAGLPLFVTEWGTSEGNGDGRIDLERTRTAFWPVLDQWKIGHTNWSIVHKGESSAAITPNAPSNPTAANPWTDAHLTPSGRAVREKLRSYPAPGTVGILNFSPRTVENSAQLLHGGFAQSLILLNGRLMTVGAIAPGRTAGGFYVLPSAGTTVWPYSNGARTVSPALPAGH